MFRPTIKLDKNLWERIKRCARAAGYSSPQELVEHALEKELARIEEAEASEQVVKQLKGLGYLE